MNVFLDDVTELEQDRKTVLLCDQFRIYLYS